MEKKTELIAFKCTEEMKKWIQKIADREQRSISQVVYMIIQEKMNATK